LHLECVYAGDGARIERHKQVWGKMKVAGVRQRIGDEDILLERVDGDDLVRENRTESRRPHLS
jgi:hypothetical protein